MKKRGRQSPKIMLTTGADASLWRYESLADALKANLDVLATLVHAGEVMHTLALQEPPKPREIDPAPVTESVAAR